MWFDDYKAIGVLEGKVLTKVEKFDDEIYFYTEDKKYKMYHDQDCCESVYVEDIIGDLDDLLYTPILMAEEATEDGSSDDGWGESATWTFYKFGTLKGYVTIRWYGSSNGYYSESVSFVEVENEEEN